METKEKDVVKILDEMLIQYEGDSVIVMTLKEVKHRIEKK